MESNVLEQTASVQILWGPVRVFRGTGTSAGRVNYVWATGGKNLDCHLVEMRKLVLLMAVLFSGVVMAQETTERREDGWVFVKDGNGVITRSFFSPTPQIALEAIQTKGDGWYASMVLEQTAERRSPAELDAFADDLARLVLENPTRIVAANALSALAWATRDEENPYERGLEVLIDIYEAMDGTEAVSTFRALLSIFDAAGGEDYLKNLYSSLERPEKPCWLPPSSVPIVDGKRLEPPRPPKEEWCPYETQWCEVGDVLAKREVEGIDPFLVYSTCDKRKDPTNPLVIRRY